MKGSGNIQLPDDGTCAFCAYLRGDKPYTILTRTGRTATLITREQRGVSHLLVMPVRHVPTILELTDEESSILMIEICAAARLIDSAYARPGIAVWQNNGEPAAQKIPHVHFHVAGTLPEGGTEWGTVEELSVAETDAIAQKLRAGRGS